MGPVTVTRTRHGPFERLSATASVGPQEVQLSAYRIGDLLVDTGSARSAAALVEVLRDCPPRRVVLTHHHEDHAGGVTALRRAYGDVPVYAPSPHVERLRHVPELLPYRVAAWGRPEPVDDAIAYDPGAVFEVEGIALEAVATPGHTPGHVALVARVGVTRFAVTGDLYVGAKPYTAWFESAADDLVRSWGTIAAEPVCMLPTHGKVRDDGERALAEVAERVQRAAEQVMDAAARLGTRDPAAVATAVFGAEPPFSAVTRGEFSFAAFARSVLDPVRTLPAAPVRLG